MNIKKLVSAIAIVLLIAGCTSGGNKDSIHLSSLPGQVSKDFIGKGESTTLFEVDDDKYKEVNLIYTYYVNGKIKNTKKFDIKGKTLDNNNEKKVVVKRIEDQNKENSIQVSGNYKDLKIVEKIDSGSMGLVPLDKNINKEEGKFLLLSIPLSNVIVEKSETELSEAYIKDLKDLISVEVELIK